MFLEIPLISDGRRWYHLICLYIDIYMTIFLTEQSFSQPHPV